MILSVWMTISGLPWWYSFYKNILEDADGRSLLEIFRNPNMGHPHEFLLPQDRKRNPHLHRDLFPGTPRAKLMPTCFNPINHVNSCVPKNVRHGTSLHRICPKLLIDSSPSQLKSIDSSPSQLKSQMSVVDRR